MRAWASLVLAAALVVVTVAPSTGIPTSPPSVPAGPDTSLAGLPLTEVPAPGDGADDWMVVWLTGDGGWAETDKGASAEIAARGVPVVGFNTLHYFWARHDPDAASADLARVLRHYYRAWNKRRAVLVGYSFGGSVVPFMYNRLPDDLRRSVNAVILLGAAQEVDFKFHVTSWLGDFSHKDDLPVLPELERMRSAHVICFYGDKDKNCICPTLPEGLAEIVDLRGGHRIGSHYESIADSVMALSR